MPRSESRSVLARALGLAVKAAAALVALLTPLLGVWVASSLAAFANGPVLVTVLAGLLLFPVLPGLWELVARFRRTRRARRAGMAPPPPVLTLGDRLILRTLALNSAFLAALLWARPEAAFTALSTRGDWMLDGRRGPSVDRVRRGLFGAAAGLEWLYLAARENPFDDAAERKGDGPVPGPDERREARALPDKTGKPPDPERAPEAGPERAEPSPASWPSKPELHPVVAGMPAEAETSLEAVARYVVEREPDAFGQVKALHDWVADRIAYDGESYVARRYPPQDPETVFRTRKAVCAGYSKLLAALGRAAGHEVAYVVGDARTEGQGIGGESHAWNAVRVDGRYYLVDVTWDSGHLRGAEFVKKYRTDYFLTPAEVFGVDHFPEDSRWQLRDRPLSRGEFFRQPMMAPGFYARGLRLVAPERSQVDVRREAAIDLENPRGVHLLASYRPRSTTADAARSPCEVRPDPGPSSARATVRCALPGAGRFDVLLFAAEAPHGIYPYVGQLQFNSD